MSTQRRWTLGIEGMTCDGCARGLDRALGELDAVIETSTSYPDGQSILIGTEALDRSAIAAVVAKNGYRSRRSRWAESW